MMTYTRGRNYMQDNKHSQKRELCVCLCVCVCDLKLHYTSQKTEDLIYNAAEAWNHELPILL